jgi:hypothetical protein
MSVTITPQPLVIGQLATLKWFLNGGIPSLPDGGLLGRIRFQWYQNNQPKINLDSTYFAADSLIFIVPSSITGCVVPGVNFKIGAANSDVGTSAPGGLVSAFTNTFSIVNPSGVKIESSLIPNYKLYDNYPNPFNSQTKIKFEIPNSGLVQIKIFDMHGKGIETLVTKRQSPGTYEVTWDASKYSSGVYFYKLITNEFNETKKMLLIK